MTELSPADEPAARLQPGGRRMQRAATWLLGLVVLAAMTAGAPALLWWAATAGWPSLTRWTVVVIIDGVIVVLGLAAMTRRGRGEPARWMWCSVGFAVAVSAAAQAVHTLTVTTATTTLTRVVAAVISALPPAVTLLASHAWLDLAVAPSQTAKRRRSAPARVAATGAAKAERPMPPAPGAAPTRTLKTTRTRRAAKMTAERQAELVAFIEGGGKWADACVRFDTSKGTISRVLQRETNQARLRSVG